jgi:hypothetical protein
LSPHTTSSITSAMKFSVARFSNEMLGCNRSRYVM